MADVSGSRIAVPPDLGDMPGQVQAAASGITDDLNQLRSLLAPLQAEWTGRASDGHVVTQGNWNTAANNLMGDVGTLGQLSHATMINWDNYVAGEGANTQSWAT
jgi:WXG100 family type VII secretion target